MSRSCILGVRGNIVGNPANFVGNFFLGSEGCFHSMLCCPQYPYRFLVLVALVVALVVVLVALVVALVVVLVEKVVVLVALVVVLVALVVV